LSAPAWREVKLSPQVLDKLHATFQQLGLPPDEHHIVRDIVHYAIEIFREDWQQLHQTPDGVRIYDFFGDDIPRVLFYGVLRSTNIYDFAIVEEVIEIFDADVIILGPEA
jgi:hypothetical protein